jgi:hypothetical protein
MTRHIRAMSLLLLTAAFATPANGVWGNLGRYIANGPGNYEIDSSLQKRFRVTERLALNVRAAGYNLLNHPQYGTPSGNFSSSAVGRITSTLNTGAVGSGAPRRIEFKLRAEFWYARIQPPAVVFLKRCGSQFLASFLPWRDCTLSLDHVWALPQPRPPRSLYRDTHSKSRKPPTAVGFSSPCHRASKASPS